jgi:DNA-binding IclR family transcriptional regulator
VTCIEHGEGKRAKSLFPSKRVFNASSGRHLLKFISQFTGVQFSLYNFIKLCSNTRTNVQIRNVGGLLSDLPIKKKRRTTGVPILERTCDMLEYLKQCPEGVNLSDIARALSVPKNTTYRMLNTLCARGYVVRNEAELSYRLTRRFATLVYSSARDKGLIEKALGPMRELRDAVRETVVISILDQQEGIVLEQVHALHPFRFVCDSGTRQALHCSASTKCIMACLPAGEREEFCRRMKFPRLTENTITTLTAFRRELDETQERGYGIDRAEALHGVHCVAAPIFSRQRYPLAAVTVTGPDERLPEKDFKKVGNLAIECARKISESIA